MQANTMSHVKVAASLLLAVPLAGCASMGAAGGKYDVVNTGNPGRPELDPWIIIDP